MHSGAIATGDGRSRSTFFPKYDPKTPENDPMNDPKRSTELTWMPWIAGILGMLAGVGMDYLLYGEPRSGYGLSYICLGLILGYASNFQRRIRSLENAAGPRSTS